MKIKTDGPNLWTHKIEEWKQVPYLPIRVSTHGKLERVRYHNFGMSKKSLAPIDNGSLINYVLSINGQFYSFAGHKIIADAFINPPAIGVVKFISGNYRDISVFNLERQWVTKPVLINVPREIVYFILKIVKEETHMYDFFYNKDIENIKEEFSLTNDETEGILDSSLKELDQYETAFDKFNTYSPFIEQYYWTTIKYLTGKGFPCPTIGVRNLSTWNGIQSCLQFVETDWRDARMEWSNKVRDRFPELWNGIST